MLTRRTPEFAPEQQLARHDKPTNVLSFPALRRRPIGPRRCARMLGDIAIAYETTRKRPMTSKSRSIIISAI